MIGAVAEGHGFRSFELGADGTGGELLKVRVEDHVILQLGNACRKQSHYIYMAGAEVFKFAVTDYGECSRGSFAQSRLNQSGY